MNPQFKAPGFLERLREAFFGSARFLDCIQIDVSSICPGACSYCPHATQRAGWQARNMQLDTFASLWPLLRVAKRAHLQGWGEPLMNPLFFEFQALADKAGCQTSTTSCGLKMDEALAAKLANSGMDLIAFSLAGTDAESNAIRKNVPFDKVCQSIRLLRNAIDKSRVNQKLEIHIAYILLADRIRSVAKLPQLMADLNVDMCVVSTMDYLADSALQDLAFLPHETEKIAAARDVLKLAAEKAEQDGRLIYYSLPDDTMPDHGQGCRENVGRTLYVDATGQISPCIYLNLPNGRQEAGRRIFGNAKSKNPLAIWQGEDFRYFRQQLLAGQPDAACLGCPKRFES